LFVELVQSFGWFMICFANQKNTDINAELPWSKEEVWVRDEGREGERDGKAERRRSCNVIARCIYMGSTARDFFPITDLPALLTDQWGLIARHTYELKSFSGDRRGTARDVV
jgi:hypothetical protein